MKIVWSWLLELVELDRAVTVEEGARALTAGGLEIEGMTDLGAGFGGVVVAEVVGKRPHPQADKLTLVDVIDRPGGTAVQVVCGAANVPAPGAKVLWARPGATLPGGMTIAPKAVKGITSPGMLCSETELGVGDDDSGIVVLLDDPTPAGAPAQQALGVDDWVLEVNVPANRGDCLGHLGLAQELVALVGGRVRRPTPDLAGVTGGGATAADLVAITIADAVGCPRYTARVIDGVTVRRSPRRFAQRLRAVGVRPISNLVDVSNYVMFELGQPQHAFDAERIAGARIDVRRARVAERVTTLDGVERALVEGDLVIADGERAVALAGVMGGLDTEVTPTTRRILLESASFDARSVRRTARRLGLHSEASHRFERGVDPDIAELASARAAELIARLGGGTVAPGVVDVYPQRRDRVAVPLRLARARALTGVELTVDDARDALTRLGFEVAAGDATETLAVVVPTARTDVAREVDLIEELLRVRGYDQVPATLPALRAAPRSTADAGPDRARRALAAAGLAEAITFGFQHRDRVVALQLPASDRRTHPIAVRNPMSVDQAVMRTSLWPNLLAAVTRNRSFGVNDVALFEVGAVFLRSAADLELGGDGDRPIRELADEPSHACVVLSGRRPGWLGDGAAWDYFAARGLLEALWATIGTGALRLEPARDIPYLHPGVAARVVAADGTVLGEIGEIHPATRQALGVDAPVFGFDLDLSALAAPPPRQMRPIPRFPAASRDVSLLVTEDVAAARVEAVIEGARQPLVERVQILEDYRDAKLPAGHKGMLWSITYRSLERTLTDAEVDLAHEAIVARLLAELPAQRR